jgi:signal peptidase II
LTLGSRRTLAVAAACALLADQLSKAAVTAWLEPGERVNVLGPLDLHPTHNTGVAFSLFSGSGALLAVLAAVALLVLVVVLTRLGPTRPPAPLGMGLILGGAAGNLVDRARLGYVVDFIDLPRWPEFNVADSCLTVGVVLVILATLRR